MTARQPGGIQSPPQKTRRTRGADPYDRDPVTYEAGWDSTAGMDAALLNAMVYCWWLFIGGAFQILFGGMYLGTPQATQVDVTPAWYSLLCVVTGALMVTLGFGMLRLERWVYWGGWGASALILVLSGIEIVRWITGVPITLETAFFAIVNVLFALYNAYLLVTPATRKGLRFHIFKGSTFSPGVALAGIALGTIPLAGTLFVHHINRHISDPTLLTILLLGGVLLIVMGFMALELRPWVWITDLAAAAVLAALSIYVLLDQFSRSSVDVEGVIFSVIALLFVAQVVYLLLLPDVRAAIFGARAKQALFSPKTLIGGLCLAVLALVIYMLPGELGKPAIAHTVVGLTMGAVVGLIPGANPAVRISAYFAGLMLAFASYVVRGGLLPYTKGSAAVVVPLLLVVVTGITAVVRSRAWFVLMLLGVGTMYGLVEPEFTAAPSGYLASAGLAFVTILLGFGLGYTVSSLLELELVPYVADPTLAHGSSDSGPVSKQPARKSTRGRAKTK